jgi:hypothetical protein
MSVDQLTTKIGTIPSEVCFWYGEDPPPPRLKKSWEKIKTWATIFQNQVFLSGASNSNSGIFQAKTPKRNGFIFGVPTDIPRNP